MSGDDDRDPADWPHPNERPCDDCGHIWFRGERRHEYLDHGADDPADAEVLCALCRRRRRLARVDE